MTISHTRSRASRALGFANIAVSVLAVAAALYLGLRTLNSEFPDWIMGAGLRAFVYGTAALTVILGMVWIQKTRAPVVVRALVGIPLYAVCALLMVMTYNRLTQTDPSRWPWPVSREKSMAARLNELSPVERAEWGARVGFHRAITAGAEPQITLPQDWSFPDDVTLAVVRSAADSVRIWARAADGTTRCTQMPDVRMTKKDMASDSLSTGCTMGLQPPAAEMFVRPIRVTDSLRAPVTERIGEPWTQYRGDGHKSAVTKSEGGAVAWRSRIDGDIRASFSVVGNLALIGAHGNGSLGAFDLTTGKQRWSSRVPNWIHQDVVSDGRVAVVGFGDNLPSFFGHAPSGVSAYAVGSGRHLWTQFDESSVMTSPVVSDSVVVYSSAAGVLRKRSIATGALLGEVQLPERVIMGPPASVGDTVVFSLERGGVCALLISSLKTLWCRVMPFQILTGHNAPSIANGVVITSSLLRLEALSIREVRDLPRYFYKTILRGIVKPRGPVLGQRFEAFLLRDGSTLWSSRAFPHLRVVPGHTAGTAVVQDSVGVIVMPVADTVAAFSMRTGDILWTAPANGSRGPPLVIEGRVVNSGQKGTTEVRNLATGELTCTMNREIGYDRSGPTAAGGLVLFADLKGMLEAIPWSALLACDSTALQAAPR